MATMTTYTGAWLKNAYVDPRSAFVPTADPVHGETDTTDPALAVAYDAPPLTEAGPVGAYPGSEWVVSTPGTLIDHTDYDSHESTDHGTELGADVQLNYSPFAPTQAAGEQYVNTRFEGLPGQGVSDAALKRGLNSLPENNPQGFPRGQEQVNDYWVNRKFMVGERVHDRKIVTPNTADYAHDIPASTATAPYSHAFRYLGRPITNINQRPELRRPPEPVSDDILTDGGAPVATSPSLSSWVVG